MGQICVVQERLLLKQLANVYWTFYIQIKNIIHLFKASLMVLKRTLILLLILNYNIVSNNRYETPHKEMQLGACIWVMLNPVCIVAESDYNNT